jgi:phosphate transport system substrate-binding protein
LLPSSEGIISEVRDNPNAIGYDGLGYIIPEVKTIAIAPEEGEPYVQASVETVTDGTYPISRDLYMYFQDEPQGVIKKYLEWILSPDAQAIVSELGFVPVRVKE